MYSESTIIEKGIGTCSQYKGALIGVGVVTGINNSSAFLFLGTTDQRESLTKYLSYLAMYYCMSNTSDTGCKL